MELILITVSKYIEQKANDITSSDFERVLRAFMSSVTKGGSDITLAISQLKTNLSSD